MRYHLTMIRMANTKNKEEEKKKKTASIDKDAGKLKTHVHCSWIMYQ